MTEINHLDLSTSTPEFDLGQFRDGISRLRGALSEHSTALRTAQKDAQFDDIAGQFIEDFYGILPVRYTAYSTSNSRSSGPNPTALLVDEVIDIRMAAVTHLWQKEFVVGRDGGNETKNGVGRVGLIIGENPVGVSDTKHPLTEVLVGLKGNTPAENVILPVQVPQVQWEIARSRIFESLPLPYTQPTYNSLRRTTPDSHELRGSDASRLGMLMLHGIRSGSPSPVRLRRALKPENQTQLFTLDCTESPVRPFRLSDLDSYHGRLILEATAGFFEVGDEYDVIVAKRDAAIKERKDAQITRDELAKRN